MMGPNLSRPWAISIAGTALATERGKSPFLFNRSPCVCHILVECRYLERGDERSPSLGNNHAFTRLDPREPRLFAGLEAKGLHRVRLL